MPSSAIPCVQLNGKRLVPNNATLAKFMAPLLVWFYTVVAIFGVSFMMLSVLQAPLSSLNAAAHVMYRTSRIRVMGACTLGPGPVHGIMAGLCRLWPGPS